MGAVVEIWFESLIPFLLKDSHIVHWASTYSLWPLGPALLHYACIHDECVYDTDFDDVCSHVSMYP